MNDDEHWSFLESCKSPRADQFEQNLRSALEELPEEELRDFMFHNRVAIAKSNTPQLKAFADVIFDSCSDSQYIDFYNWLPMLGKFLHNAALENADQLVQELKSFTRVGGDLGSLPCVVAAEILGDEFDVEGLPELEVDKTRVKEDQYKILFPITYKEFVESGKALMFNCPISWDEQHSTPQG